MSPKTLEEPARQVPVLDQVDVLVAGGGVSGCAAAVSAARAGAKTVLVERNGCLGGVATATLMANIGNLVPRGVENVLVGSAKSISTVPRGLLRRMSGCMICGQAAGVASAVAARAGVSSADVPVCELQKELLQQGVNLGPDERTAQLGLR